MPSETEAPSPEPEELQFDRAEFDNTEAPAAVACTACRQPIVDHYYEINGTIVCDPCRERIAGHLRSGSGFLRFLKAIVYGSVASLAGAAIYFAVYHFFQTQASLISILCGFMIGKAVHKASGGRGGWIYQILAVLQTYLAIGIAYAAILVTLGAFAAKNGQAAAPDEIVNFIVKSIVFANMALITPFAFAKENVITLAIIVFALWEAWKLTRKTVLVVTGPYQVGEVEPEPEAGTEGASEYA